MEEWKGGVCWENVVEEGLNEMEVEMYVEDAVEITIMIERIWVITKRSKKRVVFNPAYMEWIAFR